MEKLKSRLQTETHGLIFCCEYEEQNEEVQNRFSIKNLGKCKIECMNDPILGFQYFTPYIIWHLCNLCYFITIVILTIETYFSGSKMGYYFIYVTNMTLNWSILYFIFCLFVSLLACSNNDQYIAELEKKCYIKLILMVKYVMQTVLYSVEQTIILSYFIFLFKGYNEPLECLLSISYNGILGIVLIIDVCFFNREIMYFKHIWMPLKYSIFFFIHDIIYANVGDIEKRDIHIYDDWNSKPMLATLYASMFLLNIVLIHMTTWVIHVVCSTKSVQNQKNDKQIITSTSTQLQTAAA